MDYKNLPPSELIALKNYYDMKVINSGTGGCSSNEVIQAMDFSDKLEKIIQQTTLKIV